MSRSIEHLEEGTRKRCQWLLGWAEAQGIRIIVTSTLRSMAEQAELYARGRTKPGPIVTDARPGYSWHNFGRAFDICFTNGKRAVYSGPWEKVAKKAAEMGLRWGIRLKNGTLDKPHFQYEFDNTGTRHSLAYYLAQK